MQMHDYARKPRGRKVFSGRRQGEARAARRENEGGGGEEEEEDEKVESKGNEIMYATGARAFLPPSLSTFRPFPPSLHSPPSTLPPFES